MRTPMTAPATAPPLIPPPPEDETGSWEPPPLFQAFPQSVKHATLQACVFPPEVLMRTQSQRRQAEIIRERIDTARDLSVIEENSTETKKLEKTQQKYTAYAQSEDLPAITSLGLKITEYVDKPLRSISHVFDLLWYRSIGTCADYLVQAKGMEDWKSKTGRDLLLSIQAEMNTCEELHVLFDVSSSRL